MQFKRFKGSDGVTLAADVGGDPRHPPVLLMHGGGQTRFSWGKAARELIRMGYHVISLDLRGHGDSDWAQNGDYRIDAFVRDLHAVVETLPGPAALVGASLGGIASLVAIGESARAIASALVLVDVVPRLEEAGTRRIRDFMTANPDGFGSIQEVADAVTAYLPDRPRPPSAEGLMKNLRQAPNGRYHWHWDPAFVTGPRSIHSSADMSRLRAAAGCVNVPTLLVHGKLSDVVSPEGIDELLDLIPGAQVAHVQGASHMVAGDKNDIFNQSIESFLRDTIMAGGHDQSMAR